MQPEAQIEYGFDQRKLQDLKENLLNVKVRIYGSVSAGREKWPFNVLFFLKVEPLCDQT